MLHLNCPAFLPDSVARIELFDGLDHPRLNHSGDAMFVTAAPCQTGPSQSDVIQDEGAVLGSSMQLFGVTDSMVGYNGFAPLAPTGRPQRVFFHRSQSSVGFNPRHARLECANPKTGTISPSMVAKVPC